MPGRPTDPDMPQDIPSDEVEDAAVETEENWDDADVEVYPEQGDGP